ncbi:MAG: 50S ribosomal protein L23 [Proteobacteria bacterium]|nr:50S ribosomal protein L23 [Pseudomonadota bacterium]
MAREKKKLLDRTTDAAPNVKSYGVIVAPIITEKSSMVGGTGNVLVFEVAPKATKTEIKSTVEKVFKVNVVAVRTCNFIGKTKRTARGTGRRPGYRKAYVTLQEGQTVNIVEGL